MSRKARGTVHVPAKVFKDQSLALVRRVAQTGEQIIVTVRGEPIAKLSAVVRRTGNTFVGAGRQNLRLRVDPQTLVALTAAATPPRLGLDSGTLHPSDGPHRLDSGGATAPRQLAAPAFSTDDDDLDDFFDELPDAEVIDDDTVSAVELPARDPNATR